MYTVLPRLKSASIPLPLFVFFIHFFRFLDILLDTEVLGYVCPLSDVLHHFRGGERLMSTSRLSICMQQHRSRRQRQQLKNVIR